MYKPRTYREWVKSGGLVSFEVIEKETDLFILAEKNLEDVAREAILNCRKDLEGYIIKKPDFRTSLEPVDVGSDAPRIVRAMAEAAKKSGVGPMAAVAGAIAEFTGRALSEFSEEVIVENGGDIFIRTQEERIIAVYAGERSPFTGKLKLAIGPERDGIGVCTSSGTVSHSLSFGRADAVTIISKDTSLADAAATAVGNSVRSANDIEKAIGLAKSIRGVDGLLILIGDKMGSWGKINLI